MSHQPHLQHDELVNRLSSSDETQIRAIFATEIEANIKKGWEEVAN